MFRKRIVRLFIQLLIVVLLLEIFLRALFYQQVGRERLAIIETVKNIKRKINSVPDERIYQGFLLARHDSSNNANRLIAAEAAASNSFEYTAWTEYKNIDFSGQYINTKGLVRKSIPDSFTNPNLANVKTIYFLGGSTVFGVNTTDRETVVAAFVNEYKRQFPEGVSIKVVNYGIPAYHSYNELMLLSHLVYSQELPDAVVVLDGLNDFLMPYAVMNRLPYYYYRLKQASKDKINFKELEQINDSTATLYDTPPGYSDEKLVDTLVKDYLSNLQMIKKVADGNHFQAFFFIQPNPFYNYPNKKNDPVCDRQDFRLVEKSYTELQKQYQSVENCFFLGNMLAEEKGYPFIDRFHYAPSMCRKIATELVKVVGEKINLH